MTDSQVLRESRVFSALGDTALEKIAGSASEKEYEAGTTLFQEGASADEFFFLLEGKVALQLTLAHKLGQSARKVTVDIVSTNDITGWSVVVEPYTYTITAVCLQKVRVLSISGNKLRWLMQDDRELGSEIFKGLSKVIASRLDDTRRLLISERSAP